MTMLENKNTAENKLSAKQADSLNDLDLPKVDLNEIRAGISSTDVDKSTQSTETADKTLDTPFTTHELAVLNEALITQPETFELMSELQSGLSLGNSNTEFAKVVEIYEELGGDRYDFLA